jgi:HK97 family phage major capsid protein
MPPSLTASRRLDWLRDKRESEMSEVAAICERAAEADRDLNDEENSACQRRRAEVERLDRELAVEVDTLERASAYDAMASRIEPALRPRSGGAPVLETADAPLFRSPGEYIVALKRSRYDHDAEATQRLERYRQQLERAHQTTDSNPGLLPVPILGPVISDIDNSRPAVAAATSRPMPGGGEVFMRPVITSHLTVDKQTAEKSPIASSAMTVDKLTITKETFAGGVNLSLQDQTWSEPAILDILVTELAAEYSKRTDLAFTSAFSAAVTQTVYATTGATPAVSDGRSWQSALYEAAAIIFGAGAASPSTLWAAPDVWAALGALSDDSGRPMFPAANPFNGMGQLTPNAQTGNVAGFRIVVDRAFTPGTAILGDPAGVETYETIGGLLQALQPSVLGNELAYYGYFASAVVRPKVFVKIVSA